MEEKYYEKKFSKTHLDENTIFKIKKIIKSRFNKKKIFFCKVYRISRAQMG